jgi:hypothetical protein
VRKREQRQRQDKIRTTWDYCNVLLTSFRKKSSVLSALPSISDMSRCEKETELRQMLNACDPLCYPMLRWILMSNRAHLAPVPEDQVLFYYGLSTF